MSFASGRQTIYRGRTPAKPAVRQHLNIYRTDSIDFIRLDGNRFNLSCLHRKKDQPAVHLLTANDTILLFTDAEGNLLTGNYEFSYTLSRTNKREGPWT